MHLCLMGLLLVGCAVSPPRPPAVADANREAFIRLLGMVPSREGASANERLFHDYAPTRWDVRRFLWTGKALDFSHGRPLTPPVRAFLWKNLDRHPEFTREYFPIFPDEYLDRAARDADFKARYEGDSQVMQTALPIVLEDLDGDAKFLRGRLHGQALRKYLAGLQVQQLKVVVGHAFLHLNHVEQEWCVKSLSTPKEYPGTASCGTTNFMFRTSRQQLAGRYAVWAPRCIRFLARPSDALGRQLADEYRRLSARYTDQELPFQEIDSHLFARTLLTVEWSGRAAFENTLQEWPDLGMLGIRLNQATSALELERFLTVPKPPRARKIYLDLLADLACETGSESAFALLLTQAEEVKYFRTLPSPNPELLKKCKICLLTSHQKARLKLALDLVVEGADVTALPLIRTLERRARHPGLHLESCRRALGDVDPKKEAATLYAHPELSRGLFGRRARNQVLNSVYEQLACLWIEKPDGRVTKALLTKLNDATDLWLLQQLMGKPTAEMLGEAALRRSYWRRRRGLLQPLAGQSGGLRGLHSLICGSLPDQHWILTGRDEDAALGLLAAARYARVPLPLDSLPDLAQKSPTLRRAVLAYLVSLDGPEVKRMLRTSFGEGSLPGMLGSQDFQVRSAPIRARLRVLNCEEEAVALVTRDASFCLRRDRDGNWWVQVDDRPERSCPHELADEISDTLRSSEEMLFCRQDGPGTHEMLLVWSNFGHFQQAYFSDPEVANPQGKLILQLLGRFRRVTV